MTTEHDRTILLEIATRPGTYASAISRRTGIQNRAVGRVIAGLEEEGLCTRAPRIQKNGARTLTLTGKGMAEAILYLATSMTGTTHAAD